MGLKDLSLPNANTHSLDYSETDLGSAEKLSVVPTQCSNFEKYLKALTEIVLCFPSCVVISLVTQKPCQGFIQVRKQVLKRTTKAFGKSDSETESSYTAEL